MNLGQITTRGEDATRSVGRALAQFVTPGDVLVLAGDLGAGKTALTKGIAEGLGVVEPITSPTFNILLVHDGRIPLYHFDLYRLENSSQLDDIDYWATLEADGLSIVEWGDRFPEAMPQHWIDVQLMVIGDTERRMTISAYGEPDIARVTSWLEACRGFADVSVERVSP